MKAFRLIAAPTVLFIVVLMIGCAAPPPAKKVEPSPAVTQIDRTPTTLAILPFENNSITDPERYAPLGKGLSAMLITDLKNAGTSLRLIERAKIQSLLKEVALSQSGSVDEATAIQAGKILGAQSIAFGSFMVLGNNVRIDTRIVKVETSELMMAESIVGGSDAFIGLERDLAKKIAASLQIVLKPATSSAKSSIDAALFFSQGIEALDKGDKVKAKQLFQKSIALDPGYKLQVANVGGLD